MLFVFFIFSATFTGRRWCVCVCQMCQHITTIKCLSFGGCKHFWIHHTSYHSNLCHSEVMIYLSHISLRPTKIHTRECCTLLRNIRKCIRKIRNLTKVRISEKYLEHIRIAFCRIQSSFLTLTYYTDSAKKKKWVIADVAVTRRFATMVERVRTCRNTTHSNRWWISKCVILIS